MINKLEWLKVARETRQKIAVMLEIPRTGQTHVEGNRVTQDGHTDKDLAHLTLEKLQAFMGSTSENFYELFHKLVANVEIPPVEVKMPPANKPNKK